GMSERGNPAERLPKLEKQNQPMTPTEMQTVGCRDRRVIVLRLLFTMKIPTTTCGVTVAHRSVRLPAGSECSYFSRQSGVHPAIPGKLRAPPKMGRDQGEDNMASKIRIGRRAFLGGVAALSTMH